MLKTWDPGTTPFLSSKDPIIQTGNHSEEFEKIMPPDISENYLKVDYSPWIVDWHYSSAFNLLMTNVPII